MANKSDSVRALARGLKILRYVNMLGETKAGEIAKHLKIPRPTVYRLLQTLEDEGYVAFSASDNRVRVAAQSVSLGDNYRSNSQICELAAPLLYEYTREYGWPVDLSLYENAHMIIQESTHARSSMSIDRGMIGFHLPMLRTSAGRAYLAFCDDNERELIIQHIRKLGLSEDLPYLQYDRFLSLLKEAELRGYATRDSQTFRPETASFALPISLAGEVVACISTIWIAKAMPMGEAISRYKVPLLSLANNLELKLIKSRGNTS